MAFKEEKETLEVMVLQVCTYVRSYQMVHIKYVQFIVCHLLMKLF